MIKRVLFSTVALVILASFFFGRDALSYLSTSVGRIKQSVKESVPVGFELDRARKMVKDLVPDIQRNMHVIAQEEVQVDQLQHQIVNAEQKLGKDKKDLLRLKADAESAQPSHTYGGRVYTVAQVKSDLSNRFERFKTSEATLSSLQDICKARQKSLDAARQKLEGMLAAKRQLEVDIENLEARQKMVEVAQTTSNYQFDDSQLGQVKELVSDLRTRLQVAEKMVNAESNLHDEIPLDAAPPADIVDQVTTYFDHNAEKPADEEMADAAKAEAPKVTTTEKSAEATHVAKAEK
jgi:chromosome segregation ATPase